ncbi:MAG: NCS1 family nucleobase:cation symporter-1 [Gemmatimonadota bacterium]|nr:NCS1 family nucleobase:cation symporter-1 [Gemmatimonadota bacterium]
MSDILRDLVELEGALPAGPLVNDDIAPTRVSERTWGRWHIASLWVGMSVCIPSYMLAAAMIESGMNWWQSLLAILVGNVVVFVPLAINAHAGTRYGIPFPVYSRAAFGPVGAHVPSILRSVVACGWFGIQTWIGGLAVTAALGMVWPGWLEVGGGWSFMGYGAPQYLGFLLFWVVNMYFVWAGTESIRKLETLSAPFLIVMGLALLAWAVMKVGSIGEILEGSRALGAGSGVAEAASSGFPMALFIPWVTAMVGYWATVSLNIPDFTRYAKSQEDQAVGQAVGLLTTMPLIAFVGVAVTSATVILYGEAIWNPIDLVTRIAGEADRPVLGLLAMVAVIIATLSTNIAANVVAPANSFSNLKPGSVSFRAGGIIAGVIGILIFPWKLLDMYQVWLISYSGLLGSVGGVIVCDYVVIRRGVLDLRGLYEMDGPYAYRRGGAAASSESGPGPGVGSGPVSAFAGINPAAMVAVAAGILVALAGTLHPSLTFLFNGAWFSAALVSFVIYYSMMRKYRRSSP